MHESSVAGLPWRPYVHLMQGRAARAAPRPRRPAAPPRGAAATYDGHVDTKAVTPRPAATVVLLRQVAERVGANAGSAPAAERAGAPAAAGVGPAADERSPAGDGPAVAGGLEVLLTHRPASMVFAPDMHVFPGGRVDEADADPRLAGRSVRTADDAALALGGDLPPAAALAAFIAAIRETFEETGVLLADGPGDPGAHDPGSHAAVGRRTLEVARAELLHVPGAFAPMVDALDLRLRTDLLVPLSRWVTPPGLPRRFDTRFFAAGLPIGAEVSLLGDEVVAHAWHTPRAALDAMATGKLGLWLPTSSTLQQLLHVRSLAEIRERLSPGMLGEVEAKELTPEIVRVRMPAGGGVAGQPVNAYLVGTGSAVIVDPGDPTGPALDRALEIVAARGGTLVAIALTQPDPDHAAGAETLRELLDVPVYVGPGGGRDLPYRVTEVEDGDLIEAGTTTLRVLHAPGPNPGHLALIVGSASGAPVAVLAGDLDGARGARCLPGPSDDAAWATSVARLRSVAPDVPWFSGHAAPDLDS